MDETVADDARHGPDPFAAALDALGHRAGGEGPGGADPGGGEGEPVARGVATPVGGGEERPWSAQAFAALVESLGVDPGHTDVVGAAREVLAARGHRCAVVGLRWGVLVVEAEGAAGHTLVVDRDQVLAELAGRGHDQVRALKVRGRRR